MTLTNRNSFTCLNVFLPLRFFFYYPHYEYNKENYPLKELEDFCHKNRYKVRLENLNQKQLVELARDNLSKDELEEENDYHALCHMGLVGHDINPTKAQGYNDINLQHVRMLIDPVSTDLNKPAQLIQAPGRLRCLNPNRHSTFCYSRVN